MTYDDWKTTDPADPADAPTKTTPHSERCNGCAGTGWAKGVVLSRICEAGCAGAGTRLVWR